MMYFIRIRIHTYTILAELRSIRTGFAFYFASRWHPLVMGEYNSFIECRNQWWVRSIIFTIERFIIFAPQLLWILLFFQANCAPRPQVVSEVVNCGPNARCLRLLLGIVSFTCELFRTLLEGVHSPYSPLVTGVSVWGGLRTSVMVYFHQSRCDKSWGPPILKRPTGLALRNVEDIFRRMISTKNGLRLISTLLSSLLVLHSRPTIPLLYVFHLLCSW